MAGLFQVAGLKLWKWPKKWGGAKRQDRQGAMKEAEFSGSFQVHFQA